MVPLQLSSVSIEKLNVYLHVWIPEVLAYATSTVWDRPITKAKSSAVGLEPKFSSSVKCQPPSWFTSRFTVCTCEALDAIEILTPEAGVCNCSDPSPHFYSISSLQALCLVHWLLCNRKINDQCERRRFKCSSFSLQCILLMWRKVSVWWAVWCFRLV